MRRTPCSAHLHCAHQEASAPRVAVVPPQKQAEAAPPAAGARRPPALAPHKAFQQPSTIGLHRPGALQWQGNGTQGWRTVAWEQGCRLTGSWDITTLGNHSRP